MKYVLIFILVVFAYAKGYTQAITAQTQTIDILEAKVSLRLNPAVQLVSGEVGFKFDVLKPTDSIILDARTFSTATAELNGKPVNLVLTDSKLKVGFPFQPSQGNQLKITYSCSPQSAMYFVDNQNSPQLWTQGQGKYSSHWLPSIDDMNDKIIFDFSIESPKEYMVLANGKLLSKEDKGSSTVWQYDMEQAMSSYLAAIVVGKYAVKKEKSFSGVPLEMYYYPQDSTRVEPTYRFTKTIFDFLESEIGVPFPWQNYKQVPVKDFLYAGMENTGLTIFSDSFVVDSIGFTDRNYVNVNAHEMAHQWFGDMVTETKSEHHWLHEGFATYYALLAEREIFGDDYFYYKLYESAEQLKSLSDAGKGQKLVAAGGSSLTYYQKGAWALHILKEEVGEEAFAKAVRAYLISNAFKNVTTKDFMDEVARESKKDLTVFKQNWLYQSAFQATQALESLKKSSFMKTYFELIALRTTPLSSKNSLLMEAISSENDYLGQEAIYQLANEAENAITEALYEAGLNSSNVFIRQAIAESRSPDSSKALSSLEVLMDDPSYTTQELSLLKAWLYHRKAENIEGQKLLLDSFKGSYGFSDGNLKLLWLALSLATPEYMISNSQQRGNRLIAYTDSKFPYQLRENAFRYCQQLGLTDKVFVKNLMEACTHHSWRFRESARKMLTYLLSNKEFNQHLEAVREDLNEKEKAYLDRALAN